MKQLITYFIKYPVAVNLLLLLILIFGISGLTRLKSSFLPLSDSFIILVNVTYPGASPEEIEEGIVLKIEDNLRGLPGIDRVTSVSSENSALITIETFLDYDIDAVLAEVKNAVDRVPSFPVGMEPPIISKQIGRNEVISFTLSGKKTDLKTLKNVARRLENELRAKEGISQIETIGFPEEEIEIAVKEQQLRTYQLSFEEVAQAVANANILTTGGTIKTETEEYLIRANNRAYFGDELDYIVIRAQADGTIIYLKDVAEVHDKWSESPDRLYYNGDEAILIKVSYTNNEDLLGISELVNNYIEDFNRKNQHLELNVTNDFAVTVIQRTTLLAENGALGIVLVLVLLSLFLKPSIALWVAVGLPVSFFGMFMIAPNLITLNILSLFGMIVVIGILVDDGIVVGENIYHHYEKGKNAFQAALDGTLEVLPPIFSAILTTIVAFSAFFFVDGSLGDSFGEVATVVIITLAISLVEALIILPAHIAHSKALQRDSQNFILNVKADQAMSWMRDKLYAPALAFFMRHKIFGFAIPVALFILTGSAVLGGIVKTTFFPRIASDRIVVTLKMPQGTNESITDSIITKIERATWKVNEVFTQKQTENKPVIQNVIKRIGPGTSTAELLLNLLPGEERDFAALEISNALEEEVGPIYGIESLVYGSGSNFRGAPVSVSLLSNNIKELKAAKNELKTILKKLPELKDVSDNDPTGIKEIKLQLKEKAYLLGLNLNSVMAQIRSGFFGRQVQRFQRGRDEIKVWVRYDKSNRKSIQQMDDMQIITPTGSRVALSEIATYSIARGEVAINHLEGIREIRVDANLKDPKGSATDILEAIQVNIMPQIQAKYPSIKALYEGQNREVQKITRSTNAILPIVLFLIYVIIGFTFRSYSQSFLLFLMVPFSLVGVAWGHYVHGFSLSALSWLGVVTLIGIVVNDGLVLIGKFNQLLRAHLPFEEALLEAGKSRFRAIFLTSITTIVGLAPIMFETSRQAQFVIPIAISIAYGIFMATFLTLFMLPMLLSVSNGVKVYWKWLISGKKPKREEVERAVKEMEEH